MKKQLLVIIFLITAMELIKAQESYQSEYLVFHNMLMKPDTVLFSFWQTGDTLNVKRIIHNYFPMNNSKTAGFNYRQQSSGNAVSGPRVFSGKHLMYRFGIKKYIISNDTVYHFLRTNSLSRDSLKTLFGHNSKPGEFNEIQYRQNLQIIRQNQTTTKKVLFHPGMFREGEKQYISAGRDCADSLLLRNKWQANNKTYYAVEAHLNCLKYQKKSYFIIDSQLRFHAFERQYIDRKMKPYITIKPFKGKYFLKN